MLHFPNDYVTAGQKLTYLYQVKSALESWEGRQEELCQLAASKEPNYHPDSTPAWVLVVDRCGAGDCLMTQGILSQVKKQWPACRIEYHLPAEKLSLVENNPDITFLLPLSVPAICQPDLLFLDGIHNKDLLDSPGWHRMRVYHQVLGIPFDPWTMRRVYYPTVDEIVWAENEIEELPRPIIAIHPFAISCAEGKCWPEERWQEVIDKLPGTKFVFGGAADGPSTLTGCFFSFGHYSLRQSMALLSQMDMLVCGDSFMMHGAEAVGLEKVVCLWGATRPQCTGLFGAKVRNLEPKNLDDPTAIDVGTDEVIEACLQTISPPSRHKLDYIIVNWHSADQTEQVLMDLLRNCSVEDYRIIIVDNESDGGYQLERMLDNLHPNKGQIIKNKENLGFPAAVNQALAKSTAEVVVLLNPDIRIFQEEWDARLLQEFQLRPRTGVIGLAYNEDCIFYGVPEGKQERKPTRCDRVNGAALAISRACLNKVPWLDESFSPGVYDEYDYCARAAALGFEIWWVPMGIHHQRKGVANLNNYEWDTCTNGEKFNKRWERFILPATGNVPCL